MGIDKFIWMLFSRHLDHPLWGECSEKCFTMSPMGLIPFSGICHAFTAAVECGYVPKPLLKSNRIAKICRFTSFDLI